MRGPGIRIPGVGPNRHSQVAKIQQEPDSKLTHECDYKRIGCILSNGQLFREKDTIPKLGDLQRRVGISRMALVNKVFY